MAMSWRNKLSWRWIIRGTFLGLLGFWAGLWVLSYFFNVSAYHDDNGRDPLTLVQITWGELTVFHWPDGPRQPPPRSWRVEGRVDHYPLKFFTLIPVNEDFLGFTVGSPGPDPSWWVAIPLWFPTAMLAVVAWFAWRTTRRGKTGRGFPIEPNAERASSVLL